MKSYLDLIDQTFYYPTEDFRTETGRLFFHEVDLMAIIHKYGTPLKLTYLPKISENIRRGRAYFQQAIEKHNYSNDYVYCYCTKSSHFSFVLEEVLKNDVHIETSSSYDVPIIRALEKAKKIQKNTYIIANGFKRPLYTQYLSELLNDGFENTIPVLDNLPELKVYEDRVKGNFQVGIRVAADEEPNFSFYTSRLGIRYNEVVPFYENRLKHHPKATLKLLHFFINTGIQDTAYYWHEFAKFMDLYCKLKKLCPELEAIDIGGGFPIKHSLFFDYDYQYMADQIVGNIKDFCDKAEVAMPRIFTEFGSYTVGESGAVLYSVLDQKQQNDKELWYMVDGSMITHLPDVWGQKQKLIMLAINNWEERFQKVNLGGLTCDSMDFYNSDHHQFEVFMPQIPAESTQYIGFFHTGAYQESLGGYGGIQHCLIPAPQHIILNRDENGKLTDHLFAPEQDSEVMMKILGYQ